MFVFNQKKKTRFAGLFFLTGLRPVLPLGQCSPSKSVALHPKYLHKSALALWSRQIRTYNVNVTNTQQQLRTGLTGEAWPACRAIRPFHSNTTSQAMHGHYAEQFNFSFKQHLTGKAWPACRAILPFHSNTT